MTTTISKNKLQEKQVTTAENIILQAADLLPPAKRHRVRKALYPEMESEQELISEAKAAKFLGISKMHLWRWRKGKVENIEAFPFSTYPVPGGSGVRYLEDELRAFVKKHLHKPEQTQEDTGHETS